MYYIYNSITIDADKLGSTALCKYTYYIDNVRF